MSILMQDLMPVSVILPMPSLRPTVFDLQAQAALAATIEHANTQVQRNQQLQQQLRLTEDSRDSLSAALVSEQAARTEAEQRLVETERTTGDRITMLTTLTAQQSRAIEVRWSCIPAACIGPCLSYT